MRLSAVRVIPNSPQTALGLLFLLLLLDLEAVAATADETGDATTETNVAVLMIGNSHSSRSNLPTMLRTMLEAGIPDAGIIVERAPGWAFLADRLEDRPTLRAFDSRPWTHVILQAQKYSTSGRYSYPTDGAEQWIRRTHALGAVPILFPEWARRGNDEEAMRVQRLHESIAAQESACVAPVGIAWEVARENQPGLVLHVSDGNHANRRGALLTAYVLYEVVSGRQAEGLPHLGSLKASEKDQAFFRRIASALLARKPACEHLR